MSLLLINSCVRLRNLSQMAIWREVCPVHRISKTKFHSFSSQKQQLLSNLVKWKRQETVYFNKLLKFSSRHFCGSIYSKRNPPHKHFNGWFVSVRFLSKVQDEMRRKSRTSLLYVSAIFIFMVGMSYAGVPLYRMFCQSTGLGGQAVAGHDTSKIETMKKVEDRIIRVKFNADVHSSMRWNFKPQQSEVKVLPGETALAFYTAKNPTDKPIIGISTYNVVPFEAGQYFNKIQCFCFEEQILNPHEQAFSSGILLVAVMGREAVLVQCGKQALLR